jgi:hypothetical protein
MLTVRSIRHTPKPGCNRIPCFIPLNLREVLSQNSMELAPEDEDEGISAQTKENDVL